MKRKLLKVLSVLLGVNFVLSAQILPTREQVVSVMRKVGDYQISQPWPLQLLKQNPYATGPKSWVAGAFYPGVVDLYEVTGDTKYLDYLMKVGYENKWEQGPRLRAADDQAILQTYLDLYEIKKDPRMLVAAKQMLDETMKAPEKGYKEWNWSDALFMAPSIWYHYSAISKDRHYLDFVDKMWWEAVDSLYSESYQLFYRDHRFKKMKSLHGKPVFWSRGNGWVAGGLVRVLEYMPADHPSYGRYTKLMREFASRLNDIQAPDGFWKSSLLDPEEFPFGETSGTALFCYMLAWGINHQILDAGTYLPVTMRAWNALNSAVHADGKLGYAQGGGDRPWPCSIDHAEPYAAGAFLMAGKEMLQLIEHQEQTKQTVSSSLADTWIATDGLGRKLPKAEEVGKPRKDRFVGLFYFIWQGAHGYDKHSGTIPDEGVMPKSADDVKSPYDITQMLKDNPENPVYGPEMAFHHWSEPYFGYYLPDDEWVIRKHAQMLSDAGVDVIIFDVTNGAIYQPQVIKIAETYTRMRAEGISTPSISFMINSNYVSTANRLYDQFYKRGLYSSLWFRWQGKPLLLCNPDGLSKEVADFFTLRRSWAWTKDQEWFADGKDKWPWLDHTPQGYGWHESPDKPEQMPVCIAEHPISNIGRSFHNGKEPDPQHLRSKEGLYFKEQWERALEVDPEFIFITGWNEWVAMRFTNGAAGGMMGKPIKKGDTYFVDLYNAEYSRDAEPENGELADHYYWQMVDGIRRFKGVREVTPVKSTFSVSVDGDFTDWNAVPSVYYDDKGDTFHRKHPGWGRIKEYVNTTGRNDIIEARIADSGNSVSFYVKTIDPIIGQDSGQYMSLFIQIEGKKLPHWENYQYLVNRNPKDGNQTSFERCTGGWNWKAEGEVSYAVVGNEMEIQVPKKMLKLGSDYILNFKWTDNIPLDGNPMHFLDKGDAAPNARFKYQFIHHK